MMVGEIHNAVFRGASFRYARQEVHGDVASSVDTFDWAEKEVRERFWNPAPGEVVYDVGAAFGSYTLPALALGAEVTAFEPDLPLADCLRRNVVANPGFSERCLIVNRGLAARDALLRYPPAGHPWLKDHASVLFRVVRLDSHYYPARLDWLKIDTEGQEAAVLEGARQTIRRCRPRILTEAHRFLDRPNQPTQEELIKEQLAGLGGYQVQVLRGEGSSVDYVWALPE